MSPDRITDRHGADWPVTGRWCDTCGMPLAVEVAERTHPGCRDEAADLTDAKHAELLELLATTLGARPPEPVVLGTWRRTGRLLVAR